jgi:hypothetical protein
MSRSTTPAAAGLSSPAGVSAVGDFGAIEHPGQIGARDYARSTRVT